MVTLNLQIPFESLVQAITLLELEEKQQLLEMLEQQIFDAEENQYEDDPGTLADLQSVRTEYEAGNYQLLDQFLSDRPQQSA